MEGRCWDGTMAAVPEATLNSRPTDLVRALFDRRRLFKTAPRLRECSSPSIAAISTRPSTADCPRLRSQGSRAERSAPPHPVRSVHGDEARRPTPPRRHERRLTPRSPLRERERPQLLLRRRTSVSELVMRSPRISGQVLGTFGSVGAVPLGNARDLVRPATAVRTRRAWPSSGEPVAFDEARDTVRGAKARKASPSLPSPRPP
jgi:hypothetical protein